MKEGAPAKIAIILLLISIGAASCKTEKSKKLLWQWKLKGRSYGQPQIYKDKIFVASQAGEILVGEVGSGKKLWQKNFADQAFLSGPTVMNEHLIAASEPGNIHVFETFSGRAVWQKSVGDEIIAQVTCDDTLCVAPSRTGNLYGLDRSTGNILWSYPGNMRYTSAPVFYGPYLYIGGWKGIFLSLKKNGALNWKLALEENIVDTAIVSRSVIYFATRFRNILAVEANSGKIRWRAAIKDPSNLQIFNDQLLTASNKTLKSFDLNSGKLKQELALPYLIDRIHCEEDFCYLICGKRILRLSKQFSSEVFFQHINPIFKVELTPKHLIFSDDLNTIAALEK